MTENSKNEPDWEKVVEIFEAALEISANERGQFVEISCGADEDLRREVEVLLAADSEASGFIETPAVAASSLSLFQEKFDAETVQTGALTNKKIGAFRLLCEIGRGGMGTVYYATRDGGEFEQRVAVKLIRHGMDTDLVVRRFRQERQILANLDHPFVARLLDGGRTEENLPYLVMEFVEGDALLDYCERNGLTLHGRLELFKKVCEAIVYAHAQNVLHRDLKPNNILVKPDGSVKLLDFGIAQLHDSEPAGQTFDQSSATRWLMTPEYASPEQIKGEKLTPATDIYSLGVILYELAAGRAPYKFPSRAPHEIARVICETAPAKIETNFVGAELNRIIFKAMAKTPEDRFGSVRELLENVELFSNQKAQSTDLLRLHTIGKTRNLETENIHSDSPPEEIVFGNSERRKNGLSPRRRGVRQSVILLMTGAVGTPVILFLSVGLKLSPSWMMIFLFLTIFGGVMRLCYALLFEASEPENESNNSDWTESAAKIDGRQIPQSNSRHIPAGSWMEDSSGAAPDDAFVQNKK